MRGKELTIDAGINLNYDLHELRKAVDELANQKRIENRIKIVKLMHDAGEMSDLKFKEMLELLWIDDPVPRYPSWK